MLTLSWSPKYQVMTVTRLPCIPADTDKEVRVTPYHLFLSCPAPVSCGPGPSAALSYCVLIRSSSVSILCLHPAPGSPSGVP